MFWLLFDPGQPDYVAIKKCGMEGFSNFSCNNTNEKLEIGHAVISAVKSKLSSAVISYVMDKLSSAVIAYHMQSVISKLLYQLSWESCHKLSQGPSRDKTGRNSVFTTD